MAAWGKLKTFHNFCNLKGMSVSKIIPWNGQFNYTSLASNEA